MRSYSCDQIILIMFYDDESQHTYVVYKIKKLAEKLPFQLSIPFQRCFYNIIKNNNNNNNNDDDNNYGNE